MSAKNLSSPNTDLAASARAVKLREMARTSCSWACLSVDVSQRQSLECTKIREDVPHQSVASDELGCN